MFRPVPWFLPSYTCGKTQHVHLEHCGPVGNETCGQEQHTHNPVECGQPGD